MIDLDVLIIGGGWAGLAAARSLAETDAQFLVVDSFADHLGGRAFSYDSPLPEGTKLRFDHGAQYVGDLQNAIMAEVAELLDEDALVNGAALRKPYPKEVMVLGGQRMEFDASKTLFGIPGVPPQLGAIGALEMLALLAEMTIIEWCINVVEPFDPPSELRELDQITTWDWVKSKWWVSDTVADLVRISVEALLSVEPTEISPYYLLWYTACNDGFLNEINDNEGGPQQYWLRRGTDELADRFAAPVKDRIEQGVRVDAIDLSQDAVKATLRGGRVIEAKKAIVAVSPATAGRHIAFTPPLPEARKKLLGEPMGRTLKCQVFYKSDWWHHVPDGSGEKAFDGYVGGAHYKVLWVMDNSPPEAQDDGGPFVLMTFTVGDKLDELGDDPSQETIETYVTGALAYLFGDERALSTSPEFLRLEAYLWNRKEKEVGGGPNTVFTPGMLTGDAGRIMNEPWDDKVFFASAENALNTNPHSDHVRWDPFASENLPQYDDGAKRLHDPKPPYYSKYSDRRKSLGYMDGAIHSGRYAAQLVAKSLGKPHTLPAPPQAAPHPLPPAAAPHEHAAALALLADLRKAVEGLTAADLEQYAKRELARGRGGVASWLRDEILKLVAIHGHVAADEHPMKKLAALRDFVVGLLQARKEGPESLLNALETEAKALEAHVLKLTGG